VQWMLAVADFGSDFEGVRHCPFPLSGDGLNIVHAAWIVND
jgi:hypothetical protein